MTLTDDQFFCQLRDCSLPASHFTHLGHVRLAWICLRRFEREQAIATACGMIANYAASLGAAGKFHRTVTEALMRLLWETRLLAWPDFVQANARLLADARAGLAHHYSDALLASDAARSRFVAPDLAPLPA